MISNETLVIKCKLPKHLRSLVVDGKLDVLDVVLLLPQMRDSEITIVHDEETNAPSESQTTITYEKRVV